MSPNKPVNLNALPSAVASNLSSLEHLHSNDYFQQMLSIDSALETLNSSRSNLALKLQARPISEEQALSAEAAAEYHAIPQSIADLDQLVETFEGLQAEARHQFELRARSLRRSKTGIMDMPVEVLTAIFQNFRPPLDFSTMSPHKDNSGADVETIKNIRLTCLRFRQNSSHLLIGRLDVSPNMASLDLLNRVSSHPEISKGERILNIDLRYYLALLAEDPNTFSGVCFDLLQNSIECLESSIRFLELGTGSLQISTESLTRGREEDGDDKGEEQRPSLLPKGVSVESAKNGMLELERVLSIWKPFRNNCPIEGSAQLDPALLALRKGHERYRKLYQQQQRLIQDGSFARAVAATAAASKSKVWLSMSDLHISRDWRIASLEELAKLEFAPFADPNRFDDALSYVAQPHSWWLLEDDSTSWERSKSLLREVPLAFHAADINLAGLEVCVQCPAHKLDLNMSDEQLSCFREVTKDLKAFKFSAKPVDTDTVEDLECSRDLYAYLRAAMGRQMVPNLYLDLDTGRDNPYGIRFPIEPLMRSSNWHGLKSAVLGNFDMELEDLRRLIDMLEPGTRLRVGFIHLRSGTWATALDCLRSKVSQDSWLSSPRGAECDHMGKEEYEGIFEVRDSIDGVVGPSKATQHIRSVEGVENPLRFTEWLANANLQP